MSDINAISSSLSSLVEEIMNSPHSMGDPFPKLIDSASSIGELEDKLNIIENANKGQNIELTKSITQINNMINENASLDDIKTKFSNS